MNGLKWESCFTPAVFLEQHICTVEYNAIINFNVEPEYPIYEHEVAIARCKFLLDIFDSAVFISINNPFLPTLHKKTRSYLVTLPEEPIDCVIADTLLSKCIAISEGRLTFNHIEMRSSLGDDVILTTYVEDLIDHEYLAQNPIKTLLGDDAWWHKSDRNCSDILIPAKGKPPTLRRLPNPEWDHVDLQWEEPMELEVQPHDFPKREPVPCIGVPGWKPHVIVGGKKDE